MELAYLLCYIIYWHISLGLYELLYVVLPIFVGATSGGPHLGYDVGRLKRGMIVGRRPRQEVTEVASITFFV